MRCRRTRSFLLVLFLCAGLIAPLAPRFLAVDGAAAAAAAVSPAPPISSGSSFWTLARPSGRHPSTTGPENASPRGVSEGVPEPAGGLNGGMPSATALEAGWVRLEPAPQDNNLWSVKFANAQTGWAVGDLRTIIKTADGGATWTRQGASSGYHFYSLAAVGAETAWAVGSGGFILKTINGGADWTAQASGTYDDLNSVFFVDAQTGWAAGGWTTGYSTILKTTDGGATWTAQSPGTSEILNSIFFVNAQTGWAVGEFGRIIKTTDGGATWADLTTDTSPYLSSVFFVDAQTGWAAGSLGIIKTTNGGTTWANQTSGTFPWISSLFFVDAQSGWAVGAGGVILNTRDGGATWTAQASGTTNNLSSVAFAAGQTGWAVGDRGTMLRYAASSANTSPTAVIDYIAPNPAQQGQLVSLAGRGTDADGDAIQAYNWRCYRDGQMGTQASFTKSDFSLGTHTMYLKVQDNRGAWSEEVSLDLEVTPSVTMSHQVYVPALFRSHRGGW